jgi:UDP-3-O-[3-hydroxymyristoyl] glucosamine N-acyltransferase
MADPRFFSRLGPITLGQIAGLTGAEIGRGQADFKIYDVAPLDKAEFEHLSFFDNVRYRDAYKASKAGACFIHPMHINDAPAGMSLLVTKTPYRAYAHTAQMLYPDVWGDPHIAETARIHPTAKIGKGCLIEDYVVIGPDAEIGEGCWIEAHSVIGRHVILGQKCRVGSHTTLSHCIVGQATRFYPGVRIGQDGFGFAIDPAGHVKVPQLGRVLIGDHVEIGSNTCIDRGAGPDTEIGDGCWIDNLVQVGHNVKMGRGCIIVGQAGIAGSTVLEDFVVLAAQAGVAGHLTIGKGARVAAKSGIMRDIPAGEEVMGYPALPIRQFMRQIATLNHLSLYKKKGSAP